MMMSDFTAIGIQIPPGRSGEIDVLCPSSECRGRKKNTLKTLSVNTYDGTYYCHHCGWSGKVGTQPGGYGAPLPRPSYTIPAPPPEGVLPDGVQKWFASRGIEPWVLEDANITAGTEFCGALGKETMTVRFPYFRDGKIVNIKYRAQPKHFWMVGGAERVLYGLDDVRDAETLIITEGEMDKLSVDSVQAWPCCSVPDGAPSANTKNYGSKFTFLEGDAEAIFAHAKTVILATDGDEPGKKLGDELARRIGYEKCKRVEWPEDCKDANDVLMKHGKTALASVIADAQPYPVAGIVTVRELYDRIEDLYLVGYDRGVTTGLGELDTLWRPRQGLLVICTGMPGHGKSHVMDNVMVRLAERHGWRFAVCSPESLPLERHAANMMAIHTGKPFTSGPTPRMSLDEMRDARAWLDGHFAFVLPETPTVDRILELLRVLVYRNGIRGAIIDPWTELDHTRPNGVGEQDYITAALTKLRMFARLNRVLLLLSAHPTKMARDEKTGLWPVPTLRDISGSAQFSNKADVGLSVWRNPEEPTQPTQVHVQKIRFAETGQIGQANFSFDLPTSTLKKYYDPGVMTYGKRIDELSPWDAANTVVGDH